MLKWRLSRVPSKDLFDQINTTMSTTYSGLLNHLYLCTQDRNLAKPSGGWDALADFASAERLNVGFPNSARENILRLAAITQAKGKFSGSSARWGQGYAFAAAWKDYVSGAANPEIAKLRRAEAAEFRRVARLFAAIGGAEFIPAGE